MFKITNIMHGAVLNREWGQETASGLEIAVKGYADPSDEVLVNNIPCLRARNDFACNVNITERISEIRAETINHEGQFAHAIKVIWDKSSFKRYRFFIDDCIFFLADIHKHGYTSLFECFFLRRLQEMNRRYGVKFVLNCFYRNDHVPFTLSEFPERYKSEWLDNAGWLKLSFHAYSEFPDRPYQNASGEKLAADYDLVRDEIVRFAAAETFCPPIVIHWAMVNPACLKVLVERGVNVLSGQFLNARMAVGQEVGGEECLDIGYFLDKTRAEYLKNNSLVYDFQKGILFEMGDICCNLDSAEEIGRKLELKYGRGDVNHVIALATHEQYAFPFYANYIPDHFERIEVAVKWCAEHNYRPVFPHEGILGNTTWGHE
ncbi:MAG: hypothetical protein Q7J98_03825 [Kiritimatiellia bacterium]|nr:hypothetical protein [Kiritimatiellia bacterium]